MKGINWSNNYEETVYFPNIAEQTAFFKNQVAASGNVIFPKQSYQRHSKNTLRILANAEMIMDYNYLMFQNKGHGGIPKWFYAFITNIEYVNENTTDVYYEIDEIQTWFWGLKLGQCFVDREIPETDYLFENLIPENLETGDYLVHHEEFFNLLNPTHDPENPNITNSEYTLLLTALTDPEGNYPSPDDEWEDNREAYIINGIPCGLLFYTFPIHVWGGRPDDFDLQTAMETICTYNEKGITDNIVNLQLVPSFCVERAKYSQNGGINTFANKQIGGYFLPTEFNDDVLGKHYIPRNQKLYSYPYMQLVVSNGSGNIGEFRFENFDSARTAPIKFQMEGNIMGTPAVMITPLNHKGMKADYDSSLVLSNFPTIPLMNDTFKAYMAQNKASLNTQVLASIVGSSFDIIGNINNVRSSTATSVIGAMTGNPTMATVGKANAESGKLGIAKNLVDIGFTIAGAMAQVEGHRAAPKTVANLTQSDSTNIIINHCGFTFYTVGIRPDMARAIDNYFDMFGYAQHRIKTPNINSRPHWNYTKTIGCNLEGSCPANTKTLICAVFDKGIRFWKKNDEIGNYSLLNMP